MRVLVLKDFSYSDNGISSVVLKEGSEHDVKDSVVKGLIEAGLVNIDGEIPKEVVQEQRVLEIVAVDPEADWVAFPPTVDEPVEDRVVIPDNWKTMKWFALKALAMKISGKEEVSNAEEAREIIQAELIRSGVSIGGIFKPSKITNDD